MRNPNKIFNSFQEGTTPSRESFLEGFLHNNYGRQQRRSELSPKNSYVLMPAPILLLGTMCVRRDGYATNS